MNTSTSFSIHGEHGRTMNILFSITYYRPYVSGLTIYVKRLAEALVKRRHQCAVLCMQHDAILAHREEIDGVSIVRSTPNLSVSKGFLSINWFMHSWRLVKSHDVVLVNLPQFEGVVPALFGKLMGKRVISIYHCEIHLSNTFIDQMIQSVVELSNMVSLLCSDTVVTYTEDFAKHSKLLRWVKWKVKTVYPPIAVPTIDATVQKRLRKQVGKADIVIGVAARLAAEKGIEYLLDAIPHLKIKNYKLKIVIAGPMEPVGEAEYKRKILGLVETYKNQVVFLGTLSQKEIGAFYSLLDVLVLPSINSTEAFGMVQVEAMYCGVPVVATNLPGVRVPIKRTGMGLIVPIKNSQKLAEAIVEIIRNKEKYRKTKAFIDKEFLMEKTVQFVEQMIKGE